MTLDIRSLQAFCEVAEHGSLTRAAAATGDSQSALSRRLSALEQTVRGRLFHRTGRGLVLTELGERLQRLARAVLANTEALLEEARGERQNPSGDVILGAVPSASRPLVADLCATLRERYPRIRLRAVEAYSGAVEEWLSGGRIDIGIFNHYGQGNVKGADLLLRSSMVLVQAAGHASDATEIQYRGLQDLALVLPPRPNALVACLNSLATRQGFTLDVPVEMTSTTLTQDAVARAGLATIIPHHVALRDYRSTEFTIQKIVNPAIRQSTWLAATTQRPLGDAARAVLALVRELSPRRLDEQKKRQPRRR